MTSSRDIMIDRFVRDFLDRHHVEIWSKGYFPNWNSIWVIDGQVKNIRQVKRLLIPLVMTAIGPDPPALKRIIRKLMVMSVNNQAVKYQWNISDKKVIKSFGA